MYDYKAAMRADIEAFVKTEMGITEEAGTSLFELQDDPYDALWCEDSVTGNGSGSYTFSRETAREYVMEGGRVYLTEALDAFDIDAGEVGRHFLNDDWEWFDVTIRCYLLSEVLYDVLNEMAKEGRE